MSRLTYLPSIGGGTIIPEIYFDEFMQKLVDLVAKMTVRTYPILREQIVDLLQELHEKHLPDQQKEFSRNICSKHWWFEFIDKYKHIQALWKAVPRKVRYLKNPK